MPDAVEGLTDWTVNIDEISFGMYKVVAVHASGATIRLTGADPTDLIRQIKLIAPSIQKKTNGASAGS